MREAFSPLLSALRKFIILAIVAIPVLWIIQWVSPHTFKPFNIYKGFLIQLWNIAMTYWDWALIAWISYIIAFNLNTYYAMAERLRWDRLLLEMERWGSTPFIPPLLLLYLVAPQPTYSPYLKDFIFKNFYKDVVNLFRDRVYINSNIPDTEPNPKLSFWKIVGFMRWIPSLLGVLALGSIYFLIHDKSITDWIHSPQRFFLPVIIYLVSWIGQQWYAMVVIGGGKKLRYRMVDYFGEDDPKITWREVFPDRDYGNAIIKSAEGFSEKLQREYYNYKRKPIPTDNKLVYDCPTLPPYPYPTNEIPEWASDMERYMTHKLDSAKEEKHSQDQKAIRSSKGKVVELKKRKLW